MKYGMTDRWENTDEMSDQVFLRELIIILRCVDNVSRQYNLDETYIW